MSHLGRLGSIVDDLTRDGYSISEDLLAPEHITALAQVARNHDAAGRLTRAGTGKVRHEDVAVRGDSILWLEQDDAEPSVLQCLAVFDELRRTCNEHLFMNLHDVECHFAIYPPGTGYQRHLDQFATGDQRRRLSIVLYLNEGWTGEHGGALRLYLDAGPSPDYRDISSTGGRLVVFESSRFWHEVLPSTQQRVSVAGWFRTRS